MTDSRPPLISVLMPVYNVASFVREAVESILCQTYTDFELVIVDDGSTDGSLDILETFATQDSRIVLISRPNTGIVGALNDGLDACRGEFIARMDADDIALPIRFARQLQYLLDEPDCVLVGSAICYIDPDGRESSTNSPLLTHDAIEDRLLHGSTAIVHPTAFMRRDAVLKVGAYRKEHEWLEDLDLWLRLAECGQIANLPDILLKYRRHEHTVCFHRAREQWRKKLPLIQEAFARRGLDMPRDWVITRPRMAPSYRVHQARSRVLLSEGARASALIEAVRAFLRRPISRSTLKLFVDIMLGSRTTLQR